MMTTKTMMMTRSAALVVFLFAIASLVAIKEVNAFTAVRSPSSATRCHSAGTTTPTTTTQLFEGKKKGFFDGFNDWMEEMDAFVDDATSRRLGNGDKFYGKRKSNFYGEKDAGKKKDRNVPDPTEDYQGPSQAGYFKWMPDEDGNLKPVTRMKEKNIERNPGFWDKVFDKKDE
eukprot:CAMPEP_0194033508 /NCGR_PEP_ID=MMETSP0009_2-20130614/6180_1 /TAXON_ID=210454 /ORGANISM="Grammatophora oceanica, Strain CCMP 410" /LENGTH=172 /DNA_ID=CAMNT_0038674217 /DNA_START=8 /DNA_END=526 /DNA_ORIENTATION=+